MSDDDIKVLRDALANPALYDDGASLADTWSAVHAVHAICSPDRITRLLHEIDRLRAELAEAQRDAERYRWLRGDSCPDHSARWTQWEVRRWKAPLWTDDLRRTDLDAAIDAARGAA